MSSMIKLMILYSRVEHYVDHDRPVDLKNILGWPPEDFSSCCQVIYSQFGLAIHQNDHQARRRFVEWAQNEIAVVPDFHKRILFSDEAHFWLNGCVNKQNCRIWSEANPQVYVETPLHSEIRPQMLEKVIENWTSRLDYIRASRGSPMPEIIFKM
ncbi:hypothetical protein TNCV_855771 [Trichonephila clavipes]|nr:hypothetical protein TNCV_855771 [Trichonephila clavipes]